MRLQEFIELYDTHDFVKRNFEEMIENISMAKNTSGKEFADHLSRATNFYFCIYGYIHSIYGHGDISYHDSISLVDELMELFKNWE